MPFEIILCRFARAQFNGLERLPVTQEAAGSRLVAAAAAARAVFPPQPARTDICRRQAWSPLPSRFHKKPEACDARACRWRYAARRRRSYERRQTPPGGHGEVATGRGRGTRCQTCPATKKQANGTEQGVGSNRFIFLGGRNARMHSAFLLGPGRLLRHQAYTATPSVGWGSTSPTFHVSSGLVESSGQPFESTKRNHAPAIWEVTTAVMTNVV